MDFKENRAIYLQIADRLCDEIYLAHYKEGERIPSVRENAATVEVNANTVMRSYDYLQAQGIIYNKRGLGYFVADGADSLIYNLRKAHFVNEEADRFMNRCLMLGIRPEELADMYRRFIDKQKSKEENQPL